MLNKSNLLTYFIANIMCNIKQMPSWLWYWKLLSSSMLSFSLILQKVSLAFLVITGTQLLYCPVRKKNFVFTSVMLTMFINLLFLQPIRPLQPSSQPVQYSAVSYPPPLLPVSSTQQYSVVLYLLFISFLRGLLVEADLCLGCL